MAPGRATLAIALAIFVIILHIGACLGSAARLEMDPLAYTRLSHDKVVISCLPESELDTKATDIVMMQILKDDTNTIATIHQEYEELHGKHPGHAYYVSGHIDEDNISQSSLNVTLFNPQPEDEGIYECLIFYTDRNNMLKKEIASGSFKIEESDLALIESVVGNLIAQQSRLVEEVKLLKDYEVKVSNILDRVIALEKTGGGPSNQSRSLAQKQMDLERSTRNLTQMVFELAGQRSDNFDDFDMRVSKLEKVSAENSNQIQKLSKEDGRIQRQIATRSEEILTEMRSMNKKAIEKCCGYDSQDP